jgi:hypothetical protein
MYPAKKTPIAQLPITSARLQNPSLWMKKRAIVNLDTAPPKQKPQLVGRG